MVNTEEFVIRLQKVMDYYALSASGFAEKIEFNKSSISHLLSGRNKPSLDFVLKVLETFPEVSLYWLLNGKGNFPKQENENLLSPLPINISEKEIKKQVTEVVQNSAEIDRVIIFFKDGSFKSYEN